jgi:DpnII restriction endonuclease
MQIIAQKIDDITSALSTLDAAWQDDHAAKVIALVQEIPIAADFSAEDIGKLFDTEFNAAFTASQLFLGISKDEFQDRLGGILGPGKIGVKSFKADRAAYLAALTAMELPTAMIAAVNFKPAWSDILIERLRSGRGKAIKGQKRGRGLEDFTEGLVRQVFGDGGYETRCSFTGFHGKVGKCDIVIPNRQSQRILIEAKGYGATGSKMTDVVGDVNKIIEAKRPDTPFMLVTDGITWTRRLSDLNKLVQLQNGGHITRIYTTKMAGQFKEDLETLKAELKI